MIVKSLKLGFPSVYVDKVAVIKAVRTLTGLGLKEAKDIVDQAGTATVRAMVSEGETQFGCYLSAEARLESLIRDLQDERVTVTEPMPASGTLLQLRRLAADAVLNEEDGLAVALLDVLARFK